MNLKTASVSVLVLVYSAIMAQLTKEIQLRDISTFKIGASLNIKSLQEDKIYQNFVAKEFTSATPENCMKLKQLMPTKETYYWDDADYLVEFCRKNKIRVHGHALIWHESIPKWLTEDIDSAALEQIMKKYIQTTVKRYENDVLSWDVYNEALETFSDTLRKSIFVRKLGKDFIGRVFVYAHEAAPNAKLFYNDFLTEQIDSKFNGLEKLLDDFEARKVPIHGVAFQMHVQLDRFDSTKTANSVSKIAKRGYLIHFSELDIANENENRNKYTDSFAVALSNRYQAIASIYSGIPKEQQFGITFWNVHDGNTWIKKHFKRKYEWPLLFDEKYKRKLAYNGFVNGLKGK
jgi:endo-1,4-beta-xylanase